MNFLKYLKSKQFFKQLGMLFIFIFLVLYSLSVWLNKLTKHNDTIEVPDLQKFTVEKVATVLKELDLRYEVVDSSSYNPNYPQKSVISQTPDMNSFVKKNRKIYITLNPSNYRSVQIQEFYGKTKNEVIAQLRSSGFEIGRILFIPDIGRNVVRRLKFNGVNLKEGDMLEKHSEIDVILGNGKGN